MIHRIPCPVCGGTGTGTTSATISHADGRWESRSNICGMCFGRGDILETRLADIERGRAHRQARRASGESIFDAAARLGINAAYLSRLERGLEPWPEDGDA